MAEALRLFDGAVAIGSPSDNGTRKVAKASLRQVAAAAEAAALARAGLAQAVAAARRAGDSWRHIGLAAGVPYQTLHRQFAAGTGVGRPPGAAKRNQRTSSSGPEPLH